MKKAIKYSFLLMFVLFMSFGFLMPSAEGEDAETAFVSLFSVDSCAVCIPAPSVNYVDEDSPELGGDSTRLMLHFVYNCNSFSYYVRVEKGEEYQVKDASIENSGYSFLGWSEDENATAAEYKPGDKITVTADTTLYGVWKKNTKTYTLTYKGNGYSSYSNARKGESRYLLTAIESDKLDMAFVGWSTDRNATEAEYYAGQILNMTKNLTLYAVWEKAYSLTCDGNGYSSYKETEKGKARYTLKSIKADKFGMIHIGWSTDKNATEAEYPSRHTLNMTADLTLYAVWKEAIFDLLTPETKPILKKGVYYKYIPENTTPCFLACIDNSNIAVEIDPVDPDNPPGWYDANRNPVSVYDMQVGESYYYLPYRPGLYSFGPSYTIELNSNIAGSTIDVTSVNKYYCKDIPVSELAEPVKNGYVFRGWSADKNATEAEYTSGNKITANEDLTLYAVWDKVYTLTYDGNGYSSYKATETGDSTYILADLYSDEFGHSFMGWSTDKNATEAEFYPNSELKLTENTVLYAVWKDFSAAPFSEVGVKINFPTQVIYYKYTPESNKLSDWTKKRTDMGGSEVFPDRPTGIGPKVEHGCWYDSSANRINASDMVAGKDYYYVFLASGTYCFGPECTVSFASNGGSTATQRITKPFGDGIVLPEEVSVPVRNGYVFLGWSESSNAILPTDHLWFENDFFSVTDSKTYYAVWSKSTDIDYYTYSFVNNFDGVGGYAGFDYDEDYYFSLDVYRNAFGKGTLASTFYNWDVNVMKKTWGGNCYGISATCAMFLSSDTSGVYSTDYNADADLISKLQLDDSNSLIKFREYSKNKERDMSMTDYIEIMQVSQKCQYIQDCYTKNKGDVNGLVEEIKKATAWSEKHSDSERYPIVAVFGPEGGHAIVGYYTYGNRIYVYDSNYPGAKRYVEISKDASGSYTQWSYKISESIIWSSEHKDCWISYVPYEDFEYVWLNRGNASKLSESNSNILAVDSSDYEIRDVSGAVLGECEGGVFTSFDSDIHPVYVTEMNVNTAGLISLPADVYKVVNTDTGNKDFNVTMSGDSISATVSTSASEISFTVDDLYNVGSVRLDAQKGDTYSVEIMSETDELNEAVSLNGVSSGSQVSLSCGAEQINVTADKGAEVSYKSNAESLPASGVKRISSVEILTLPEKRVYLYKFDEEIDLTGLSFRVTYDDGTEKIIDDPEKIYCTGFDPAVSGQQTVSVECAGHVFSFEVSSYSLVWRMLEFMKSLFKIITVK